MPDFKFKYLFQQPSQPSYGYGLSQTALGQSAFSQNQSSLFLPTTPTQPESFQQLPQLSFQRNQHPAQPQHVQPFAQPQPNTIMVSSATSSLMSTSIKPPNQSSYGTYIFILRWLSSRNIFSSWKRAGKKILLVQLIPIIFTSCQVNCCLLVWQIIPSETWLTSQGQHINW